MTTSPRGEGASALGRRVGPIVAAVGLLGGIAVLVWVGIAPDNVGATVAEAGARLPAQAVVAGAAEGCLAIVDGDGSRRELCPEAIDGVVEAEAHWSAEGSIVVFGPSGWVVLDPVTGEVEQEAADGEGVEPPRPPDPGVQSVHPDGAVVRRGSWGSGGEVVLDVGGPVARLEQAAASPGGDWVVAVDRGGRVVVADPTAPTEVLVWFEVPDGAWLDLVGAVRWEG